MRAHFELAQAPGKGRISERFGRRYLLELPWAGLDAMSSERLGERAPTEPIVSEIWLSICIAASSVRASRAIPRTTST